MLPDKELLAINQHHLDRDCASQPRMMYEWGQALAKVSQRVQSAKNSLKLIWAELDQKIRSDPLSHSENGKLTEKTVESLILTNDEYREAQDHLVNLEYEEDVLDAFVKALMDRREQLSNMVKLFGAMYWSKPDTQPKQEERTARMKATGKKVRS